MGSRGRSRTRHSYASAQASSIRAASLWAIAFGSPEPFGVDPRAGMIPRAFIARGALMFLLGNGGSSEAPVRFRLSDSSLANTTQCWQTQQLHDEIVARLGYEPFDEPADETLSVETRATDHGLEARLNLVDSTGRSLGTRVLPAGPGQCADLLQALVLAACFAIDPLHLSRPEAAAPSAVALAQSVPPAAAPGPTRWSASAGPVASLGAAPRVAPGISAGVQARWDRLSLGLEGLAELPTGQSVPSGQVQVSLIAGTLAPCIHAGWLGACAVVAAGSEQSSGSGNVQSRTISTPYAALGGRGLAEFPIFQRFSLRTQLDLLATLSRTRVAVDGSSVWTSPPVSGDFELLGVLTF
jgi:hypothetical protein